MAKTLVLKGTNFSAHKIETVTFGESVPCTGITMNEQTKSVTSLSPFTLVATPAPSNTTDTVVWTSSDTDVATVADGVVTPVALGEVTITATCGNYSATCAVTINNVVVPYKAITGYSPFRRSSSGNAMTTDKKTSTTGMMIVAADQETGLYPIESKSDVSTSPYRFVPIMIPAGAKKVKFSTTLGNFKTRSYYFDSTKKETTYNIGAWCLSGSTSAWDQGSTAASPIEVEIPDDISGLDSCCFAISVSSFTPELYQDYTSNFSMVFSY